MSDLGRPGPGQPASCRISATASGCSAATSKITMHQGQLTSDEAEINFDQKLLSKAFANGKPAAFEQQMAKSGKTRTGARRQHRLRCRTRAVVQLSKDAWLSDGQTRNPRRSLNTTCWRRALSRKRPNRARSACTSPSRRRPTPNHECAAGAEPRQKLQIAPGTAGFVAGGRKRRSGRVCWARTAPARPRPST